MGVKDLLTEGHYRVTKEKSTNGHQPYIQEGYSITGHAQLWETPGGASVLVVYGSGLTDTLRTSLVSEVSTNEDGTVNVHTKNSIYKLVPVTESETTNG